MKTSRYALFKNNNVITHKKYTIVKSHIHNLNRVQICCLSLIKSNVDFKQITLFRMEHTKMVKIYLPDLKSIYGATPILNSRVCEINLDMRLIDYICKTLIIPGIDLEKVKTMAISFAVRTFIFNNHVLRQPTKDYSVIQIHVLYALLCMFKHHSIMFVSQQASLFLQYLPIINRLIIKFGTDLSAWLVACVTCVDNY